MQDNNTTPVVEEPTDADWAKLIGGDEQGDTAPDPDAFQSILGALLGSAGPTYAPGVEERFDTMTPAVNVALDQLAKQIESGQSRDFQVTLSSRDLCWVLNALGYFVDREVASEAVIANQVLDVAERLVHLTHDHASVGVDG